MFLISFNFTTPDVRLARVVVSFTEVRHVSPECLGGLVYSSPLMIVSDMPPTDKSKLLNYDPNESFLMYLTELGVVGFERIFVKYHLSNTYD